MLLIVSSSFVHHFVRLKSVLNISFIAVLLEASHLYFSSLFENALFDFLFLVGKCEF